MTSLDWPNHQLGFQVHRTDATQHLLDGRVFDLVQQATQQPVGIPSLGLFAQVLVKRGALVDGVKQFAAKGLGDLALVELASKHLVHLVFGVLTLGGFLGLGLRSLLSLDSGNPFLGLPVKRSAGLTIKFRQHGITLCRRAVAQSSDGFVWVHARLGDGILDGLHLLLVLLLLCRVITFLAGHVLESEELVEQGGQAHHVVHVATHIGLGRHVGIFQTRLTGGTAQLPSQEVVGALVHVIYERGLFLEGSLGASLGFGKVGFGFLAQFDGLGSNFFGQCTGLWSFSNIRLSNNLSRRYHSVALSSFSGSGGDRSTGFASHDRACSSWGFDRSCSIGGSLEFRALEERINLFCGTNCGFTRSVGLQHLPNFGGLGGVSQVFASQRTICTQDTSGGANTQQLAKPFEVVEFCDPFEGGRRTYLRLFHQRCFWLRRWDVSDFLCSVNRGLVRRNGCRNGCRNGGRTGLHRRCAGLWTALGSEGIHLSTGLPNRLSQRRRLFCQAHQISRHASQFRDGFLQGGLVFLELGSLTLLRQTGAVDVSLRLLLHCGSQCAFTCKHL